MTKLSNPLSNSNVKEYIGHITKLAKANEVCIKLKNGRHIIDEMTGASMNGYFDYSRKELVVATGQSFADWFPVFVHESNHLYQWVYMTPKWKASTLYGIESTSLLDLWLQGEIDLNETQRHKIIGLVRNMEHECEQMALQDIEAYNLPLDRKMYAQKANAYVFLYNVIMEKRKWYTIGREPYNIPEIWQACPDKLVKDPAVFSPHLRALYEQCYQD